MFIIDPVEVSNLGFNESMRKQCPICQDTSEKSLVLWRDAQGLIYKCYRASCGVGGRLNISIGEDFAATRLGPPVTQTLKPYDFPIISLTEEDLQLFDRRFELSRDLLHTFRVGRNPLWNTIVFPLYDHYNNQVGIVDRDYADKEGRPKTLTYWTTLTECRIGWSYNIRSTSYKYVIVVEDYVSMLKLSTYSHLGIRACTLLGTTFSETTALYLSSLYPNLIMCLDCDAQKTALKHKLKYSALFKSWTNMLLFRDVKDTPFSYLTPYVEQVIQRVSKL